MCKGFPCCCALPFNWSSVLVSPHHPVFCSPPQFVDEMNRRKSKGTRHQMVLEHFASAPFRLWLSTFRHPSMSPINPLNRRLSFTPFISRLIAKSIHFSQPYIALFSRQLKALVEVSHTTHRSPYTAVGSGRLS